ncbi:putative nucleolar RNA helicase II [Monocercomonoides exilis]|uniref:putative nucleolar RNA helicase II n=1 Tax=Monocercomonoides exilis TaxID=2049356 RepID=UPI00355AB8F3|nr:putative nucleolar RNA helicase II [Monocercomonoides exilis]|eukprot:MONOS_13861.1-p1 / transcript=MONOS_13861.1 / gene=MONOS_13861 / organism=Monocercomonoides_exilis_PA203 / gene_product=nucleolar RNA helicase II / transcript_product=nucleolar RNA helicase II / location=Mono_scaffold00895:20198-21463(-) / protein_length=356 / sequence_SO=supercontig / SO=protein_coding / is_pseudo=false
MLKHLLRAESLGERAAQREQTLQSLRTGNIAVLIASDAAARGIDIPQVDLIIVTYAPTDTETYVHHLGRTGRCGRGGTCFVLHNQTDEYRLALVERQSAIRFEHISEPSVVQMMRYVGRETTKQIMPVSGSLVQFFKSVARLLMKNWEEVMQVMRTGLNEDEKQSKEEDEERLERQLALLKRNEADKEEDAEDEENNEEETEESKEKEKEKKEKKDDIAAKDNTTKKERCEMKKVQRNTLTLPYCAIVLMAGYSKPIKMRSLIPSAAGLTTLFFAVNDRHPSVNQRFSFQLLPPPLQGRRIHSRSSRPCFAVHEALCGSVIGELPKLRVREKDSAASGGRGRYGGGFGSGNGRKRS